MLLKGRSESDELKKMRYLNMRMELPEKDKFYYSNLEKGYEGEVKFDQLTENLQEERIIINDLLLEVNNSYFQIDSLIISQGVIHLLDVKNYEGDYFIETDKLFAVKTRREYKNPVTQLNRSETLFRILLQNLRQKYIVEAFVIFINPEFTLYQAPMDQPIILPTQVKRFLRNLNETRSTLSAGHRKLAQKLISLHQTSNPFSMFPGYNYDELQKGIYCINCGSFHSYKKNYDLVCGKCGEFEKIESAILRSVEEFKLLFPGQRITTQSVSEWCTADLNNKTISRVLKKNYTSLGKAKNTYYK
ncbi:nuclease-related domain-containing protein [Ammoniphilus resinae]|uniref:Ribosomal protein S27AE n=1 Tax=Ammoniphilus resinae TaxID=861532 RepID=A0ABS4GQT9_9BACL|nr:nuclease-related domain-containing protein [Ammoniphilus resinae]MBP1932629.1 ribosomal protein S27AE [Ammoniphilus resinae]